MSDEVRFELALDDVPGLGGRPRRVWFHLRDFDADPRFRRVADGWVATIPRPPVDRLEYLVVVERADRSEVMVPDPRNPLVADSAFGPHSVLEFPEYVPPEWLPAHSPAWVSVGVEHDTDVDGVTVAGELLSPPGVDDDVALPLLVVHDGPEYSRLARLGDYLWWLATQDAQLACRALLLQPDDRDRSYSADPAYTATLVDEMLPHATAALPWDGRLFGLGASLGALAMAYAATSTPGAFTGLLCQSGSFFVDRYDAHERRFSHYGRVRDAVETMLGDASAWAGTVVRLTAGTGEENLDNNRLMASRLRALGVDVEINEGRSAHDYTAWRDLLHPSLADLLRSPG